MQPRGAVETSDGATSEPLREVTENPEAGFQKTTHIILPLKIKLVENP